jgi:hypothetical protein
VGPTLSATAGGCWNGMLPVVSQILGNAFSLRFRDCFQIVSFCPLFDRDRPPGATPGGWSKELPIRPLLINDLGTLPCKRIGKEF